MADFNEKLNSNRSTPLFSFELGGSIDSWFYSRYWKRPTLRKIRENSILKWFERNEISGELFHFFVFTHKKKIPIMLGKNVYARSQWILQISVKFLDCTYWNSPLVFGFSAFRKYNLDSIATCWRNKHNTNNSHRQTIQQKATTKYFALILQILIMEQHNPIYFTSCEIILSCFLVSISLSFSSDLIFIAIFCLMISDYISLLLS